MPNQRKSNKKKVGVWLTDEEQTELRKVAADKGFDNLADYFRSLIPKGSKPKPSNEKAKG